VVNFEEVGLSLDAVSLDMMGVARKVTIDKESTTIVAGGETKADVQKRIGQIRSQLEDDRLRPRKNFKSGPRVELR